MFIKTLDKLMEKKGINKSVLSKESGIPYTTIDGFYKKGSENIKLSTLLKLSNYFNVSLDYLIKGDEYTLNNHEKSVINAYRKNPSMQSAVDRLLGVEFDINVKVAQDIMDVLNLPDLVQPKNMKPK